MIYPRDWMNLSKTISSKINYTFSILRISKVLSLYLNAINWFLWNITFMSTSWWSTLMRDWYYIIYSLFSNITVNSSWDTTCIRDYDSKLEFVCILIKMVYAYILCAFVSFYIMVCFFNWVCNIIDKIYGGLLIIFKCIFASVFIA